MSYTPTYNCNGCFNYNNSPNPSNNSSGLEYTVQNASQSATTYTTATNFNTSNAITAYAANTNSSSYSNYDKSYGSLTAIVNSQNNSQTSSAGSYDGIQIGQSNYNSPQNYAMQTNSHSQYTIVDKFLNEQRPLTQFIGEVEQIKEYVLQAFKATTNYELPGDISIKLCNREELKQAHQLFGGSWDNTIQGFSINKTRQIFVKEGELDKVMLVIGHEIGHVLSHSLPGKLDEEAKAFAFEMAWMKTIVENNIANLKENIKLDFTPAKNGLHDISFNFVQKIVSTGKKALQTYRELVNGILQVKSDESD